MDAAGSTICEGEAEFETEIKQRLKSLSNPLNRNIIQRAWLHINIF